MTTETITEAVEESVAEPVVLYTVDLRTDILGRKAVTVWDPEDKFVTQRSYHSHITLIDALDRVLTSLGYPDHNIYSTDELAEDDSFWQVTVYDS
jgi:hypothetical protein